MLPVAFSFYRRDPTALTGGAQVSVHPAPLLHTFCVPVLVLEHLKGTKVLPAERTLHSCLPLRLLVLGPDFHALDVDTVATSKSAGENEILHNLFIY